MEKSDYFYRRKRYMQKLEVPTISEVKEELGEALAEAFFSQCPEALKPDMGLTPPLFGAGDNLWVSPSDLLIEKVCLKPPLTNKHIKALTHQGILQIGRDIEIKFMNEMELEKLKALAEQEELLKFIAEREKEQAVAQARLEEQEICQQHMLEFMQQFEEKLQLELELLREQLWEEFNELLEQQKIELEIEWKAKFEQAVAETVEKLTAQFLADLKQQDEKLTHEFNIQIKKEEAKFKLTLQAQKIRCHEILRQLRHQLECKNIANLMYILCMERRKCNTERETVEEEFQKQSVVLQENLVENEVLIRELTEDRDLKQKQMDLRETCLLEILRQFQKFINFALRAVPTQAEFLLSIEKMMVFELTKALTKADRHGTKHLAKTLKPWRADSQTTTSTKSSTSKNSLVVGDHHDCLNEIDPPISDRSLRSDDELPSFYYNKYLYVREDFRNMVSQGISITPSNMLWNKDIEHLIQILKQSVTKVTDKDENAEGVCGVKEKENSLVETSCRSTENVPMSSKSQQSHRSSVHFDALKNIAQQRKDEDAELHTEGIIKEQEGKAGILATKNSLEVVHEHTGGLISKEKRSISQTKVDDINLLEQQESPDLGLLATTDSLHKHRLSLKLRNESVKSVKVKDKDYLSKKDSKLNVARDSLIIHRRSMAVQKVGSNVIGAADSVDLGRASIKQSLQSFKNTSKDSLKRSVSVEIPAFTSIARLAKSQSQKSGLQKRSSKLSTARDSITMLRGSARSLLVQPPLLCPSRLSMHRDSLTILRTGSKILKDVTSTHKPGSKESVEIIDGICNKDDHSINQLRLSVDEDDKNKAVKMSHIEVVEIPKDTTKIRRLSTVDFSPETAIIDVPSVQSADAAWMVYDNEEPEIETEPLPTRDNFLQKPNVAKIVGDKKAVEYTQASADFTLHRANSMLRILREHPDLLKIFTSCTK